MGRQVNAPGSLGKAAMVATARGGGYHRCMGEPEVRESRRCETRKFAALVGVGLGIFLASGCGRGEKTDPPAAMPSTAASATPARRGAAADLAAIDRLFERGDPSANDLDAARNRLTGRTAEPAELSIILALTRAESQDVRRLAWNLLKGDHRTLVVWRRRAALRIEKDPSVLDEIVRSATAQPRDLETLRNLHGLLEAAGSDDRLKRLLRDTVYEVLRLGGAGAIKRSSALVRKTANIDEPNDEVSVPEGDFSPWPGRRFSDAALKATKPSILFMRVRLREGRDRATIAIATGESRMRFSIEREPSGGDGTSLLEVAVDGRSDEPPIFSLEEGDPNHLEFSDCVLVDAAALKTSGGFPTRLLSPREISGEGTRVVGDGPLENRGVAIDGDRATIRIPIDPADRSSARRIVVAFEHRSPNEGGGTFDIRTKGGPVLRIVTQPLARLHALAVDVAAERAEVKFELEKVDGGSLILTGAAYAMPER